MPRRSSTTEALRLLMTYSKTATARTWQRSATEENFADEETVVEDQPRAARAVVLKFVR